MKRHLVARSALAAAGALALAAADGRGASVGHVHRRRIPELRARRAPDVRTRCRGLGTGAPGAAVRSARGRAQADRQDGQRAGVRRSRARGRRLGQGQLRLPDDVLRAAVRARRRADRRHLRPGETRQEGLRPEPRRHVLGRGLAGRDDEHAVVQGRPARLPERVVPGHDQRRRRHLARGRLQPRPPEEARRGRGRLHQEGRLAVGRRAADQGQPDALRVRLAEPARRSLVRRAGRRHGGTRRRHPRHHQSVQAEARGRVEPRLDRAGRPRPPARRRGLQPRHGRQEDRRQGRDADVLLGRRLRPARRDEPDRPGAADPRRHRLRAARPGQQLRADPRGQRAPGRVHARQPVLLRHRRGLRSLPGEGHDHRRRAQRHRVHRRPGR